MSKFNSGSKYFSSVPIELMNFEVYQLLRNGECVLQDLLNEPAHEIMALFVLRKLILQTRMRNHPVGPDVWFLVGPFLYFHASCVRTTKALIRTGSPEPSLVAYVISTIISWARMRLDKIGNFIWRRHAICLRNSFRSFLLLLLLLLN